MTEQELLEELNSLGIDVKTLNEYNDLLELSSLIELLKQSLYAEYKKVYNEA
jgi:hypothetical protein